MRKIGGIIIGCWLSIGVYAVTATPEPLEVTQPDGSKLSVKLVGDEFHHYYTLTDGTPLCQTKEGWYITDASVAKPSPAIRKARRIAQEQTAINHGFPLTGSPKSIVILVNFSDLQFQYTREDFERMLNQSGYHENDGIGSARDYFIACSDSIFRPQFDCYGPVNLSKGYAYYDDHASQMIVEACHKVADELGVDFTQYDTNDDGRIDNVFVYYAGHNEAEGASSKTIWPHRSVVSGSERVNGKLIYDYACTSELRGSAGNGMCGIGTFCHEFGHVLGLPDYYDTSYTYYTLGSWDIMCSGSYNGNGKTPPTYSAGERFQLGWITPVQLKDAGVYTLEPLTNGKHPVYLLAATDHNLSWEDASPNEYWLLENRQHVGWEAAPTCLPGTGMLIWHVDYNASSWGSNTPNNYMPLRYDIEEAGGVRGYAADSDPYPGSKNIITFTPVLHDGTLIEQPITGIVEDGQEISFMFKSNDFMFLPAELPVIESTYLPETKKAYTPASRVIIIGAHMDPEEAVLVNVSGNGFSISEDSINWSSSLVVNAQADSTLELPLYVRYNPRKQVCDIQRGSITVRQGNAGGTFALRGTSPRPTLIQTPILSRIDAVSPTSFTIQWVPETDAEQYYLTLYHMEDGTESTMESFEGFDDETIVQESGWYTSFYRTTSKAKEHGSVSMWFKENNETLKSPLYPMPVVELSMWLNAPATTDSEVGFIVLSGYTEAGMDILDTIFITKNTKKYTYTHAFEETQGYRRFELVYTSLGGEGTCLDAFTTTFNHKTVYTYKGRECIVPAQEGELAEIYANYYFYDLLPQTTYFLQIQCSEEKGCAEHISPLSPAYSVQTKKGEKADSRHLTLDIDSISYDPAKHVIYIPHALETGCLAIYSAEGELVKTIPVQPTQNVVVLPDDEFRKGMIYIVKYLPGNALKRKNPSIKILFK